jgi:hypothetical protein
MNNMDLINQLPEPADRQLEPDKQVVMNGGIARIVKRMWIRVRDQPMHLTKSYMKEEVCYVCVLSGSSQQHRCTPSDRSIKFQISHARPIQAHKLPFAVLLSARQIIY